MSRDQLQHPAAPISAVVVLIVLTLLFAQDWNRSASRSNSATVETTTIPVTTTPAGATGSATTLDTTTSSVDSTAGPTVSTTAASIDQLTADDVSSALGVAGFPNIEVEIDGGTVTLRGVVPDQASKRAVLNQVGVVPGVAQILDEITTG